jgi:23S rRNA (pseudouridine1915-N3)-methyltransferase
MRLFAIGRLRAGPELDLFERYRARIRPKLELTELPEARGSAAEMQLREGAALLAALPAKARLVALDLGAKPQTSETFAAALDLWLQDARPVCFVIGGAEGLHADVLARAGHKLGFGALTWPHMLARVMLAEQIFRARAITAGHPYHRGARPE